MRLPKPFEYYLKGGIVKKISPDKSRANFLIDESILSLQGLKERIEKIGVNERNSNSIIKDCYDILTELIRAKMLIEGYSASGIFSHEAEISYMFNLSFSENDIKFMNDLRYFRNGIMYYGKRLDKQYTKKVLNFLDKTYPKLKQLLKPITPNP